MASRPARNPTSGDIAMTRKKPGVLSTTPPAATKKNIPPNAKKAAQKLICLSSSFSSSITPATMAFAPVPGSPGPRRSRRHEPRAQAVNHAARSPGRSTVCPRPATDRRVTVRGSTLSQANAAARSSRTAASATECSVLLGAAGAGPAPAVRPTPTGTSMTVAALGSPTV